MKVDSIAVDIGFDMKLKLILSRAEQLVKQEGTALVESKSLSYSLKRQVVKTYGCKTSVLEVYRETVQSQDQRYTCNENIHVPS